MIHGIGTDLVFIPRMARLLQRHGNRVVQKMLSEEEQRLFVRSHTPAAFLAKRFAAKEATAKALGTGFRDGLYLRDIAVVNDALGKPGLVFSASAVQMLPQIALSQSHLSLTDEGEYACAFVILESHA